MFINLIAPINQLGYGVVGYNVLRQLYKKGHTIGYFPLGDAKWDGGPEAQKIVKETYDNGLLYNRDAPCIRIWHQNEMHQFVGKGERIGWPIFELDKFDERELHHLKNLDRLFVCSKWAKEVCEHNGITIPIDVIPLGVDPKIFFVDQEAKKSRPYWTEKTTVFINVGKWEIRKGHKELCEAFSKAFKPEDDVELWMMNRNDFILDAGNEQWKRLYISSPMGHKIKILPRKETQAEMRIIFNHVDFGVFPSHAEGWNLEILELMACGVPCIATDYSGHTEFLTQDNAMLIKPTGKELAQDGLWFHGQGEWCTYDVDQLVETMRIAHDYKQSGNLDRTGLQEAVNKYTWENTVKTIEEVL